MKSFYLSAVFFAVVFLTNFAAGQTSRASDEPKSSAPVNWAVVVTDPTKSTMPETTVKTVKPSPTATPKPVANADTKPAEQTSVKIALEKKDDETSSPAAAQAAKKLSEWEKTWSIQTRFSGSFDTNLEHEVEPVRGFGMVPSVVAGFQLKSSRHRLRFIYSFAAPRYNITTDLNRLGNYFSGGYRLSVGKFSFESEAEASFKGSNEDRETGNQFVFTETIGYRFNSKTRLSVYGAYRIRRFAAEDAARNAVNPMFGLKFSRQLTKRLGWDAGFRYDINRAAGVRNNYTRQTFRTGFDFQMTKNDRIEAEVNYRPRRYKNRLVEVGLAEELRRDKKWSIDVAWTHNFSRRWGIEAAYQFERQTSNDIEKFYRNNSVVFSVFYNFGNGDVIEP